MAGPGHVELYRAQRGWRYRTIGGNGEPGPPSGEAYATKWNAKRAARRWFPSLPILTARRPKGDRLP